MADPASFPDLSVAFPPAGAGLGTAADVRG